MSPSTPAMTTAAPPPTSRSAYGVDGEPGRDRQPGEGGALDALERCVQADVLHPLARVLEREPAALGQRVHHRVEPAGGRAREQAAALVGDRDVREAGDADV